MSEFIISSDRVRDLTEAPRRLPIEVEGSVAYEVVVTIWTAFSTKETNSANDLGPEWLENIRSRTPEDLAEAILDLGGPYASSWLAVSSFMLGAPHPHDPDRVFEWLAGVDDNRLRRWIIGYNAHSDDQGRIEQAAEGDLDAAITLLGEHAEKKPELVDHMKWIIEAEGLAGRLATTLKRFRSEVFFEYEEEFGGAISRAAAARRAAPSRGSAKEVVEDVTSGIDFEIPLGVSRVVLVPSVVTRPLSLIDGHRGTLVVYYGMADEFIDSDPEAPPSWLVRTYKALADERRLRILRRLAEGPASLDDLTDLLGLSKSTVHHHVTTLRGAGLIRVHLGDWGSEKKNTFSIRERSMTDANDFLDDYLKTSEEQEDVL